MFLMISPIRTCLIEAGFKLGACKGEIDIVIDVPHADFIAYKENGTKLDWRSNKKRLKRESKYWKVLVNK